MFKRKRTVFSSLQDKGIDPEEVLLDASNLPSFDVDHFEGRVERSLRGGVPVVVGIFITLIFGVFAFQAWNLQVARGEALAVLSSNNSLENEIVFARRGVIYDRNGIELAWNEPVLNENGIAQTDTFALRRYIEKSGFAHVLGFVGYPERDTQGNWWRTEYLGKAGVESHFTERLAGKNGAQIREVDALGNVKSENIVRVPEAGTNIRLSIDADLQEQLHNSIRDGANRAGFVGGAGVIMDVHTGEVVALTSYPEYSSQILTDGSDTNVITGYSTDSGEPFLNRALDGQYTPGSIIKPFVAAAALAENIISPTKAILSTGEIRIPNPYFPGQYSVFRDWKAHGWITLRDALAVSSNVYFYAVGGGFADQKGLGIVTLAKYAHQFGFGEPTGIQLENESVGVVPTPEWKEQVFGADDPWRIGNTYHTAIGQFGFLVTPIQAARYTASIANGGKLLTPTLEKGSPVKAVSVGVRSEDLAVVRSGMRQAAESGTAIAVNVPGIQLAGKTGTAQLGTRNQFMNSWVIGYWPAEDPQFAYAAVLEKAPANTLQGAAPALRSFFEYVVAHQPEYARGEYPKRDEGK